MVKNLILSIIAIAILAGCSGKKDKTTDSDVVEAIPVKVQKLEKTDIARTLDYAANLEADKRCHGQNREDLRGSRRPHQERSVTR